MTETRTEDGQLVHAVDFEKLKGVLGEFSKMLENQRERYGMTWPGKNECLKIIQQPSVATLKPCREESVNFDETENLFIEGRQPGSAQAPSEGVLRQGQGDLHRSAVQHRKRFHLS